MEKPKAFVFDVFGTVVNWQDSLAKDLAAAAASAVEAHAQKGNDGLSAVARVKGMVYADWEYFALQWYNRYIELVYALPIDAEFERQEAIHRRSLAVLVPQFHLEGLWTEPELDDLVRLWYRLVAWPDSAGALARLKTMGPVNALSDGSVELLTSLNTRNQLGFNELWGSDTWQAYKPNPAVYLGAVRKLQLEPGEVALVAAHLSDLWAAKKCGMKAFYVERPFAERYSPDEIEKARKDGWVDIWIKYGEGGLHGVADKIEAKR